MHMFLVTRALGIDTNCSLARVIGGCQGFMFNDVMVGPIMTQSWALLDDFITRAVKSVADGCKHSSRNRYSVHRIGHLLTKPMTSLPGTRAVSLIAVPGIKTVEDGRMHSKEDNNIFSAL